MNFQSVDPDQRTLVSEALEHFWDYAYLGNHPLAELQCVRQLLASPTSSHLEKGRALSSLLRRAIQTLEPSAERQRRSDEVIYYQIWLIPKLSAGS